MSDKKKSKADVVRSRKWDRDWMAESWWLAFLSRGTKSAAEGRAAMVQEARAWYTNEEELRKAEQRLPILKGQAGGVWAWRLPGDEDLVRVVYSCPVVGCGRESLEGWMEFGMARELFEVGLIRFKTRTNDKVRAGSRDSAFIRSHLSRDSRSRVGTPYWEAEKWLMWCLRGAPKLVNEIREVAKEKRMRAADLRRAAQSLPIIRKPRELRGPWVWRLPEHDQLVRVAYTCPGSSCGREIEGWMEFGWSQTLFHAGLIRYLTKGTALRIRPADSESAFIHIKQFPSSA